jgi:uncharacterized protein
LLKARFWFRFKLPLSPLSQMVVIGMSAASPKANEPSMEDILASIRRIIADDQEGGKPAAASAPPQQAMVEPDSEEDVLDLADFSAPPAKADQAMNDLSFSPNVSSDFDFDAIETEESVAAPVAEDQGFDEQGFDEISFDDEPVVQAPIAAATPITSPSPLSAASLSDRIISSGTDQSVSQAFNMLAHTVLSNNSRTLEDLVKEMLKPMLKVWLDDNLPTLVERLVKAEIERVARGSR